jgi:integrin beta 8
MSPPGPLVSGAPAGPADWGGAPDEREPGRFDAFRPDTDEKPASVGAQQPPPPPKERNGRVLAIVLAAAVLLLVIPLGLVWVFTRSDGPTFDPAVGECVKQSGGTAVTATCSEPGAYVVQSRVSDFGQCPDRNQPHVAIPGSGSNRILCLVPQSAAGTGATPTPGPSRS